LVQQINIVVSPQDSHDDLVLRSLVSSKLNVRVEDISLIRVVRRSIDARGRNIKVNISLEAYIGELPAEVVSSFQYQNVTSNKEILIIGAGPAGLFAALRLIELGFRPVILERGKDVSARKRDIAAIHRNEGVNPDSNYGFGEGGAGTFSDGKLYTRSKKKGDIRRVLEIFHFHGAQYEILIDAHPHIGTNVLPKVITNIRKTILDAGGEIHFNSRVCDFVLNGDSIRGVKLADGSTFYADAVILATGHSARDIYYLLHNKDIQLEAKSFAVGVRVEHPQSVIDSIQYHCNNRGIYLPAAAYSFTEQVMGRGVYSFCMCPGGTIVPASTAPNEMVVNGMSPSGRNGQFANSGMVVEVRIDDLKPFLHFGELAGLKFQEELEKNCFKMAGESQMAPAQRLYDFVMGKNSKSLPKSSFHPGLTLSDLHVWMPSFVRERLQLGLNQMGQKARGFVSNDATVIGVESRTSSPVRIPRDADSLQHVQIKGLFPCGEGAGYAGGIVSSAVDGERCAERIAQLFH